MGFWFGTAIVATVVIGAVVSELVTVSPSCTDICNDTEVMAITLFLAFLIGLVWLTVAIDRAAGRRRGRDGDRDENDPGR
jgi:hypothetical protein